MNHPGLGVLVYMCRRWFNQREGVERRRTRFAKKSPTRLRLVVSFHSDGLPPTSDGLQPKRNCLHPSSDGLRAMRLEKVFGTCALAAISPLLSSQEREPQRVMQSW